MKTYLFSLLLIGAAFTALSTARADDSTTPGQTAPATGAQGERGERLKAALAQLDLTDAQKAQIKQIFSTVTDRKERRQQIVAVLTPEQKEKLKEMIKAHRSETQASGTTTVAP